MVPSKQYKIIKKTVNMKTITKFFLGCIAAAGLAASASAQITLSLSPTTQTVGVNGLATYNLNISGLKSSADYNGPALGAYNIVLDFNSAIASAQSVTFGNALNVFAGDFPSADLTTTAGQITLSDVSFDSAADLESHQSSSFTFATITFQGQAPGTTTLTFDTANTSLSDENANRLDLINANGSAMTVTAIPEPSCAAGLFGVAAVGACVLRRRFVRNVNGAA